MLPLLISSLNVYLHHLLMAGTTTLLLGTHILVALNFLTKYILYFVSVPWLDIGLENHVNFFKRTTHSLRVHEEHVERHDCTENSENDVSLPLDVVEGWCHEVCKGKVEDPVGCS